MSTLRVERRSVTIKLRRGGDLTFRIERQTGAHVSLIRSGLAPIVAGLPDKINGGFF